jgi:hypothetical protein
MSRAGEYNKAMNTIELTSEQLQTLSRLAAQTGKPPSEVLQMALASFEQKTGAANGTPAETIRDAMVRLGLLGCVTDAPADLSTNPKHMEGFGSNGK